MTWVVLALLALAVAAGWAILRDANTAMKSVVRGWPESKEGKDK